MPPLVDDIDWNKVLHMLWHATLIIGAAYAASHPDVAWIVPALQALGQQTPPLALPPGVAIPMKPVVLLLCLLPLAACSTTNISELIDALAKDPATVCGSVTTVTGTVNFARTNITSGDVKCDGLEVHSPGQTTVPVRVVPVTP